MKLRNKETKEFGRLKCIQENEKSWFEVETKIYTYTYDTLAELNEEWEDYKESEYFYYIDRDGRIVKAQKLVLSRGLNSKIYDYEMAKSIGNYFTTEEEAEKAVEKLKAWKRLKDKGAKFKGWFWDKNYGTCIIIGDSKSDCIDDGDDQNKKDLDLLFGGEE